MKKCEKFEYRAEHNCLQPTVTTQAIQKTINRADKNKQRVFKREISNDSGGTQLNNLIGFIFTLRTSCKKHCSFRHSDLNELENVEYFEHCKTLSCHLVSYRTTVQKMLSSVYCHN